MKTKFLVSGVVHDALNESDIYLCADSCSEPRPVSNLSQTFRFSALESNEGLERHGLNVWRLISVIVAWLTLTYLAGVRTDVPQSLSSTVPLFTSTYVSQSRCSPTLYSPFPIFPSPFLPPRGTPYVSQSLCFPVLMLPRNGFPSLCFPNIFPSPYVPQSLCSAVPLFPSPQAPQSL